MSLNYISCLYIQSSDFRHFTIAFILYLTRDISNITRKSIFRKYTHYQYIVHIKEDNDPLNQKYKPLPNRLRYSISDKIGCFKLNRINLECTVSEMLWYHWEYFAYNCPMWKKRFDKYKIEINDELKKIEFENVDEEEEF